jgi:hypothetical protein
VHIYRIPLAGGAARTGESAGHKPCAAI